MSELDAVLAGIDEHDFERFCSLIADARRVVCFGLGREGLALRAFAMRLMHLGQDVHVAGDVTAKPVAAGDLVLITPGPGNLVLTRAMIELARRAGATVIVVTAQPDGPDAQAADLAVTIPAQTMANDLGSPGMLPMGTAFELALAIYFDIAVLRIQERSGQSLAEMRERHFNLE
jgi:6-phospho-3-hexuloisomerase